VTYHRDINAYLRVEEVGDARLRATVAAIDAAIARSRLDADFLLFRGIDAAVARQLVAAGLRPGSVLSDAAYMSTSPKLLTARTFASWPERGLILRMRTPRGTIALDASPYSAFAAEQEVLLPRDIGIRILADADASGVMDAEVLIG